MSIITFSDRCSPLDYQELLVRCMKVMDGESYDPEVPLPSGIRCWFLGKTVQFPRYICMTSKEGESFCQDDILCSYSW
jgi:hypothetical protein